MLGVRLLPINLSFVPPTPELCPVGRSMAESACLSGDGKSGKMSHEHARRAPLTIPAPPPSADPRGWPGAHRDGSGRQRRQEARRQRHSCDEDGMPLGDELRVLFGAGVFGGAAAELPIWLPSQISPVIGRQ